VNDLKNAVLWLTNMHHNKGDMPKDLTAGVLDPKVNSAAGQDAACWWSHVFCIMGTTAAGGALLRAVAWGSEVVCSLGL
jgi:hypothetical protein